MKASARVLNILVRGFGGGALALGLAFWPGFCRVEGPGHRAGNRNRTSFDEALSALRRHRADELDLFFGILRASIRKIAP